MPKHKLHTKHMLQYAYFPSQCTCHNYLPRIYRISSLLKWLPPCCGVSYIDRPIDALQDSLCSSQRRMRVWYSVGDIKNWLIRLCARIYIHKLPFIQLLLFRLDCQTSPPSSSSMPSRVITTVAAVVILCCYLEFKMRFGEVSDIKRAPSTI